MKQIISFRTLLRTCVARGFLPIMILASLTAYALALHASLSVETAIMGVGIASFLIALLLERLMPYRLDWNTPLGDRTTDWTSFAVIAAAAEPLVKAGLALCVIAVYGHESGAASWFASDWPIAVQIIIATLLIELGKYAAHRWHHASPKLWWLHALHHGAQRMAAVNNFRYHPLNYAINQALGMLPLMLLGAPAEVLLGYAALTQPIVMVQHANIDLRSGWLNMLVSTPEVHRWHHSNVHSDGDHNFGNALLVWDHVFGTYKAVAHAADAPAAIGLYAPSSYPAQAGYFAQLLSIFTPRCCKAGAA